MSGALKKILATLVFLAATASVIPIWAGRYLPFTDLAQHIAQIAVIRNYHSSFFPFHIYYDIQWLTPYCLPIFCGALLAFLFSPVVAAKIILSLGILAYPLSLAFLLSETNGKKSWAILGFPLAFGINLFWGHLSFYVSVPLAISLWALALSCFQRPTRTREWLLAVGLMLLFFCHVVTFVFSWGVVVVLLWAGPNKLKRLWPTIPVLFWFPFWLHTNHAHVLFELPTLWALGWYRFFTIPQLIFGPEGDFRALPTKILVAVLFLLMSKKAVSSWKMKLPLLANLLICLLAPVRFFGGIHGIDQRMAVFLIPSLLLTFEKGPGDENKETAAAIILLVSYLLMLGIFTRAIVRFNKETADFRTVLAEMEGGRRMMSKIPDASSTCGFFIPYIHFPAYYQAEKLGFFEYSFANNGQQTAVTSLTKPAGLVKYPEHFEKNPGPSLYDYYLIRSSGDELKNLGPVLVPYYRLKIHEGKWWLFERN